MNGSDPMRGGTTGPMTLKRTGGGLVLGFGGLIAAIVGAFRMITLIPAFVDCASTGVAPFQLRLGAVVGIVAGIAAVVLCEMGVRRQMSAKWVGVAGSVAGIFVALGSAMLLAVTFVGGVADCLE
ncbi:MAG: hypothetical protein WD004_06860 [Actinomycetota bacterium]